MQHLIASYLFQNKYCALPGIGTLSLTAGKAATDFLDKKIKAPLTSIIFSETGNKTDGLQEYIAATTSSDKYEATEALEYFCDGIKKSLHNNESITLESIGQFFVDGSGSIKFQPVDLPKAFLQDVNATRVIHPEAEHAILVGDKESTNTLMNEYFSDAPVKKSRWWIWAIVIVSIALLALLIYSNSLNASSMAGNAMPIQ
jgi:CCDC81-like prokaryotic HU domain 2